MKNILLKNDFIITEYPAFKSVVSHWRPVIYAKYEIFEDHLGSGPVVMATDLEESKHDYDPFGQADLIRSFAQLGNDSQVIEWISRNGFLLHEDNMTCQEDYSFFMNEVRKAYQIISLFDAVVKNKREEINQRVEVIKNPLYNHLFATLGEYIAVKHHVLIDGAHTGWIINNDNLFRDIPGLALRYIIEEVVKKIQTVRLSYANIVEDSEVLSRLRATPCMECNDLLAMMYLRLYWLITSTGQSLKTCVNCGEIFPKQGKRNYCEKCFNASPHHRSLRHQKENRKKHV